MSETNEPLKGFIVIEGVDGAGTTTLATLLCDRLRRSARRVFCTCEPTDGPVGALIRDVLHGRLTVTPTTLALLFAADRSEHLYGPDGIMAHRGAGELVLCDRYLFSSLAYQSIECGFDYVRDLNSAFPLPELAIFVDTSLQTSQARLRKRRSSDLFDSAAVQRRVRENYRRAFAATGVLLHEIDGELPAVELAETVWKLVASLPIIDT